MNSFFAKKYNLFEASFVSEEEKKVFLILLTINNDLFSVEKKKVKNASMWFFFRFFAPC